VIGAVRTVSRQSAEHAPERRGEEPSVIFLLYPSESSMATVEAREAVQKLISKNKAPALIQTHEEFVGLFEQYLDSIKYKDEVPTYSNFAAWLGHYSASSVYAFFKKHPETRDSVAELLADVIVEKAITGKYRDAVAIFTLKNRCNWTDKKESISRYETGEIASADEARENVKAIMKSLGYDERYRPRKGAEQNMNELQDRIIRLAEAKAESNG